MYISFGIVVHIGNFKQRNVTLNKKVVHKKNKEIDKFEIEWMLNT